MLEKEYVFLVKKKDEFGSDIGLDLLIQKYEKDILNKYRNYIYQLSTGRGVSIEDVIQCATIGLFKGIMKFDFSRNTKILTYVHHYMISEINEYLRTNNTIVYPHGFQEILNGAKGTELPIPEYVKYKLEKINNRSKRGGLNYNNTLKLVEQHLSIEYEPILNLDKESKKPSMFMDDIWRDIEFIVGTNYTKILYNSFNGMRDEELGKHFNLSKTRIGQIRQIAYRKLKSNKIFKNKYEGLQYGF